MRFQVFIAVSMLLFSCREANNAETKEAPAKVYNKDFQTAVFKDHARLEKIKLVLPAIDSMLKQYAVENHVPGMAYGIVVDGKLVHTGNYGYSDISKQIPVTSSTMFRIASMSKSVTAAAILRLRDEGKLSLDDPASKYIPELRDQVAVSADAPVITIRHLLTHGAGFPEDNPWGDRQLADTDKEFMEFLKKKITFSNPANVAYEYSNLGFALLGKIVTTVSGKQYQDYIAEHIFGPLGMKGSCYEYSKVPSEKLAHGYRWLNEKWNEEELLHDKPDGSWGAMGSMISSVDEFSKYMAMHLQAWPARNDDDNFAVRRSSVREMHHPWRFNGLNPQFKYPDGRTCATATAYCYGLAWMQDCDGKTMISHSGGLPGFGSHWAILPDYGIGIVTLANRTYAGPGRTNIAILDTIVRRGGLKKRELPESAVLAQRRTELMKIFPDWNKAGETGIFAENFFPDNPVDTLIKYSRLNYEAMGKIISVEPVNVENQLRETFVIHGEKKDMWVYFTLSPENPGLIQELKLGLR